MISGVGVGFCRKPKYYLIVTKIKLDNQVLDIAITAGVYVDSVDLSDIGLDFVLDFYFLKAGKVLVNCYLSLAMNTMDKPICIKNCLMNIFSGFKNILTRFLEVKWDRNLF